MNTYQIKSTNAWGYDSYTFQAENDERAIDKAEVLAERQSFPFMSTTFELTRVIHEPVLTLTLSDLKERKKRRAEEIRKKERWDLYQKLKGEFEATV